VLSEESHTTKFSYLWSLYRSWSSTDMAKVRPSDAFLQALDFLCYKKKQHTDLQLTEIWSKAVNKSTKMTKFFICLAEIVTLFQIVHPQ